MKSKKRKKAHASTAEAQRIQRQIAELSGQLADTLEKGAKPKKRKGKKR